jgi:hypothetical protein
MCAHSRREPGCVAYDLYRSEAGMLNLIEVYRDADALAFHRETPHLLSFRTRLPDLLELRADWGERGLRVVLRWAVEQLAPAPPPYPCARCVSLRPSP